MAYDQNNSRGHYDKKRYNDREDRGEGYRKNNDFRGGYNKSGDARGEGGYKRSYGDKPYGERSYEKKPYGDRGGYRKGFDSRDGEGGYKRSYGDKPYGKKPYEKKPFEKKPYEKKPYEKKSEDRSTAPVQQENPVQQGGEDELPYLLIGRNAVREAVKNGRSIDRILVVKDQDGSLGEIVNMARDRNLVLRETDRKKLDEICMPFGHGGKTANHQGIVAYAAGVEYCQVSDILQAAKDKGEDPFVIVLDGIEDPYNLGSIIRSAECAGAHGVVIGKRRSASVTAAAVKSSAGATEYMKIARVVNISGAIEELKRAGLWVAGADMSGVSMEKQGLNGALALVIGSEGSGMTKLVRESCDFLVSIPMHGHIDSLNAGVAAAVLMFEKRRQDAVPAEE